MLNNQQKKALKAKAHSLNPVVMLGAKGLTEAVINEIEIALTAHELIKIKLAGLEKSERQQLAAEIAEQVGAELVQSIGSIIVLYRQNPEN